MTSLYLVCFCISFSLLIYILFLFVLEKINKSNKKKSKIKTYGNKKNIIILLSIFIILSVILNIIFSILISMIVIYFNWLYKKKQEQNYRKSVDKQIVESIRIFRNIILSGQSILQAIDAVSKQVKPPLSDEFRKIFERVSLGVGLDEALQESSLNIQSEQYKLFIDSVRISNITGAKLSDILDKIEKSITQRLVIYSKVEALTSQGKMSGNIISVVPFFIILFVYFIEPDMMSVLFTTLIGNIILFISIVMMLLGSFFMRKISEIDI